MIRKLTSAMAAAAWLLLVASSATAAEKQESFDRDPGWDGHQNRLSQNTREVAQDFGYSPSTSHAGKKPGEVGGRIQTAAEPAFYAKAIRSLSFGDRLEASGTLLVPKGKPHFLLGFFNSASTNEWRTPNSLALRILGRGEGFHLHVEYATSRWRAGASFFSVKAPGSEKLSEREISCGVPHAWSLRYDPTGDGSVEATLDGEKITFQLEPGHKADGAKFDRFGIITALKSVDDPGEFWLDDLTVLGERDDFSKDPGWEGFQNRRQYRTANVRAQFDFGFSPATRHAGGLKAGELGGLVFRGDCRHAEKIGAYGDRLSELTLAAPLRASGKVTLRRGVSDSTVLIGFYNSKTSLHRSDSQKSGFPLDFLGVAIEGPSSEGFYFYPVYRVGEDAQDYAYRNDRPPYILPDGKTHSWSLRYEPALADGKGQITVDLDGKTVRLDVPQNHKELGKEARFDRFGLVTTWIDGNAQEVFFDDLSYTFRQEK
jgi:hypothetical protein